ncbi:MAG: DNA repair protein RadC [Syntrophobacteraceae bacterium]
MSVEHDGHRKRLRERFEQSGLDAFHDHEVLELLLTYAIPRRDVKPLAKALLGEFGGLSAVLEAPLPQLKQVNGIGEHAAILLAITPRLLDRYQQDRWQKRRSFHSTPEVVTYLRPELASEVNEVFCILALNSQNGLLAMERIQQGTVNKTTVFPRLVVEAALKHRATAVILVHNHPSGEPKPSTADRQLTVRLKKTLHELDIIVHDHIIIAGSAYYSFAENGELA